MDIFNGVSVVAGVEATDFDQLEQNISSIKPTAIVNAIGIVKQDADASDSLASISINALFPHKLATVARKVGARLIQISTDCVFSGRKGNYSEEDVSDAEDLYGRTKYLGEASGPGCLTLRTSMIGRELKGSHGLVEWFYSQRGGTVGGFRRAIFTGLTTQALSQIIADLVERHPSLAGVYNVASDPISKFDLLTLINDQARLGINIEPDETFSCDRSLDGARFRAATNFVPPDWSDMVTGLVNDPTPYDVIRRSLIVS
jgi:dTDP-4-dehydrorhamnose reductase